MAPMLEAKVKSILSGDSLVLHNVRNPAQERTLSLAFVSAPRLRREGDEVSSILDCKHPFDTDFTQPFAFESRDFLRKLCVGKVVHFNVLYNIPTPSPRDYGIVTLQNGQNLLDLAVGEGWVKLRDDASKKEDSPHGTELLERLQALESRAKADEKGLWGNQTSRIENINELSDPKSFVEEWKGKPIDSKIYIIQEGRALALT